MTNQAPAAPPFDLRIGRHTKSVAVAILVLAFCVRVIVFDKSAWSDELDSYMHATAKDFIASARANVHPPLYFFILRMATSITASLPALRLISLACGLGAVMLCMRASPPGGAWAAGLLIACSPESVYQSQELRQYALLSLLLLAAFFFTVRLIADPRATAARWGLAVSLSLAAATHLVSGFFLAALAFVLGWTHRRESAARLANIALPFAPAMVLLLIFNRLLLSVGHGLNSSNWWVGSASWEQLTDSLSVALGWNMIGWIATAVGRHLAGGEAVVLVPAAATTTLVMWTAWTHPAAKLAKTALAVALIYWALVIVYSVCSLSILLPRIMLPGALLFIFSLGVGVTAHPNIRLRRAAGVGIACLALGSILPWLWYFGWHPREDLRGLTERLRETRRPHETLVLLGGTEMALDHYWPDYRQAEKVAVLNLLAPIGPQKSQLRAALADSPSSVVLVYRDDAYLNMHRDFLPALVAMLATAGYSSGISLWNKDGFQALRFSSPTGATHPASPHRSMPIMPVSPQEAGSRDSP